MLTAPVKASDGERGVPCQGSIVRGDETAILCAAVRRERRKVTLDLTRVDAIDAAGVGALVSLQASGIYLTLLNPAGQVREVLRVTQLASIFEIRESRAAEDLIMTPFATPATAGI